MERIHFFVHGRVQGVGFRYATQSEAQRLGAVGWVRNTDRGEVEVWVEGQTETVEALLRWCHQGPATARVDSVQTIVREPIVGFSDEHGGKFRIRKDG